MAVPVLAVVMACCAFYLHGEYQWKVYRNHNAWNVGRLYQLFPPLFAPLLLGTGSTLFFCSGREVAVGFLCRA